MEEEEKEEEEEEMKGSDGKDRIWYKYILFFMMFCMISDGKRLARRRAFWFCLGFFLLLFRSLCWLLVLGHNSGISHLQVVGKRGERGEE